MDIRCRRCGEPWDIFGIPHAAGGYGDNDNSDMTVEEAKKMMKGEGCPCCVNDPHEKDDDEHLDETLEDILDHEDPESVLEEMGLY